MVREEALMESLLAINQGVHRRLGKSFQRRREHSLRPTLERQCIVHESDLRLAIHTGLLPTWPAQRQIPTHKRPPGQRPPS